MLHSFPMYVYASNGTWFNVYQWIIWLPMYPDSTTANAYAGYGWIDADGYMQARVHRESMRTTDNAS